MFLAFRNTTNKVNSGVQCIFSRPLTVTTYPPPVQKRNPQFSRGARNLLKLELSKMTNIGKFKKQPKNVVEHVLVTRKTLSLEKLLFACYGYLETLATG